MRGTVDVIQLLGSGATVEQLLYLTQESQPKVALECLGQTIVANELWQSLRCADLVGRIEPRPILAAFGTFSEHDRFSLENLAIHIQDAFRYLRYVDYRSVEAAVVRLAGTLTERFGADTVRRFSYTAIPRGGLIVLGMLAYVLGIPRGRIISGKWKEPEEALVVLDDCALSGVRFQEFLRQAVATRQPDNQGEGQSSAGRPSASCPVVFCPLFAPRELCSAIETQEASVVACCSGEELEDLATQRFGEHYAEWYEFRKSRMGQRGYWVGFPELIAFPWGAPELNYWNSTTGRFEADWNVLPIGLRKKGWREREPASIVQRAGPGPLQAAADVLWTDIDGDVAIARMPLAEEGPTGCFRLDGPAATMWRALVRHGTLEAAEMAVTDHYAVDSAIARTDLNTFVASLERQGYLQYGAG